MLNHCNNNYYNITLLYIVTVYYLLPVDWKQMDMKRKGIHTYVFIKNGIYTSTLK